MASLVPKLFQAFEARAKWNRRMLEAEADHKREMEIMEFQSKLPPIPPRTSEAIAVDINERKSVVDEDLKLIDIAGEKPGRFLATYIGSIRPTITLLLIIAWLTALLSGDYDWPHFADEIVLFIVSYYFGDRTIRKLR